MKWETIWHEMIKHGPDGCEIIPIPDHSRKRVVYGLRIFGKGIMPIHGNSLMALRRWSIVKSVESGKFRLRQDCYEACK